MKKVLMALTLLMCLTLVGFLYRQIMVEGEMGPAALIGAIILFVFTLILSLMTYLSGTRHRELVRNLLLTISVTVIAYLTLDFVAGVILIEPLSPPLVRDDYRHHALVPDSRAELKQRDFHYFQHANKLGFRGRETTVEKPAGTKRILMLGDSFTMGKGVEDNETFSVLVEKALQKSFKACNDGKIEVLNGGVDSYAPILSYLYLDRDLARLSPDLVVFNLDHSDLIQEQAYRQQAIRAEDGTIIAVPQVGQDTLYEQFLSWTTRNLFITRIVLAYATRAMDHKNISVRRVVNEFGREHYAHTLQGDIDRTAQWQDIFESVERIKRRAESIPAKFLMVTYPWAHQVNDTDWVPGRYGFMEKDEQTSDVTQNTIRKHTTELEIELYEALPAFKNYKGTEPLYFKYDPHWTPLGHKIMADGLAEYVKEHYMKYWCKTK